MKPLIDGDILLHEIGWSGQFKDKETGEEVLLPFHTVHDILDEKINMICKEVRATEPPTLFFSDSQWLADKEGREFVPNFRYSVAKTKPYKGTRVSNTPFHFHNLLVTMLATYDCHVSHRGFEADDEMGIAQNEDTIICSRDKDLRQVPGWHYSWQCGNQEPVGPHRTDSFGRLSYRGKKVIGYGQMFLAYQLLIGDSVDNIPGLKGVGEKTAFAQLEGMRNVNDLFTFVLREYERKNDYYYYIEQGNLLFIRQNEDEDFSHYIKKATRWEDE